MALPTDSYAMVPDGSDDHKHLSAIGWIVTDRYESWLHMEPSLKS